MVARELDLGLDGRRRALVEPLLQPAIRGVHDRLQRDLADPRDVHVHRDTDVACHRPHSGSHQLGGDVGGPGNFPVAEAAGIGLAYAVVGTRLGLGVHDQHERVDVVADQRGDRNAAFTEAFPSRQRARCDGLDR